MKLTYFGTAAAEGWPAMFCGCELCRAAKASGGKNIRTRSQALLDEVLLFDLPPDSYMHMLHGGLDLPGIRHLLITHTHQDHFYPEDLLFRSPGYAHEVNGTLTLYGNAAMVARMDQHAQENYGGPDWVNERLAWQELKPFQATEIAGYAVTPLLARHDYNEACYIYLVEKGGKALLYGNDTGVFPEKSFAHLAGRRLSLVSLDCTTGKHPEGSNHMGVPDVLGVRARLLEMGCADERTVFVATHFSHNGQLLHEELEARFAPQGVIVAYDGLTVSV